MRKKIVFYIIAFILLLGVFLFFNKSYRELTTYAELTNRHNTVHSIFQNLLRQINNAAILTPELAQSKNNAPGSALFFTDSGIVIRELELLKLAVRDSENIKIVTALDSSIRSELTWLLKSDVPDSIIDHKSPAHIGSFQKIESLIDQGIKRTVFLIEFRKRQLNEQINIVRMWMTLFIVLSGVLLIYTTINLFGQKSKTKIKEQELEIVMNRINDAIVSVDNNWRYTFLNDAAMATHPLSKADTIGKIIWDVHPEMKGTVFWDKYHECMLTKKVVEIDSYYAPMDISFSVKGYPSADGLTIFYKDVTESKRAELEIIQLNAELEQKVLSRTNELLQSRDELSKTLERVSFLASIADNIQDPVISTNFPEDNNPLITRWNNSAEELLEWKSEEVMGKQASEIFKTTFPNESREQIFELLKTKGFWQGEVIYHTKSGVPVYVLSTISYLKDVVGNITGNIVLIRDITKRKKAEEALGKLNDELEQRIMDRTEIIKRSETQYRHLFENNPMPMWVIDLENFKFLDVNEVAMLNYGYSFEEFLSMTAFDIRPDEFKEAFKNSDHSYKSEKSNYNKGTWSHRKKDGTIIQAEVIGHEILFEGKKARLILSNDVTEQKKAEAKLLSSEKRFRSIIENNYDIISLLDKSFKVFYRSPSAARITGWSDEEMNHIDGTRNIHPDDLEAGKKLIAEVMVTPGKPFYTMFRNKHKNGHYFWVEGMLTNMLHDDDIKAIVFNFRDVTERVEAQEKLVKSEKIYKTIASSIPGSAICLLDGDFRYLLIEGDMLEKLGYSKEKLLGNKAEDVLSAESFTQVNEEFIKAFAGETITHESNSGGYDILSRFIPLKDENNVVYAIMTVAIDVTDLKNAQRNIIELNHSLEEKVMRRTSELEAVNKELEAFTYSVSHDLRAPLRAVNGYAQMLEEDYGKLFDNEGKRLMGVIKSNAIRMGTLIDELLEFSRLGRKEIKKSLIDMNLLVGRVIKEMEESGASHAKINMEDLHPVMGDHSLMSHVLVNLISNAIKYSSNNPDPIIRISSKKEKDELIFSIEDNGVGFDMKYVHKLFGVFQRLHSNDEFSGTGVGLAIVQRIVNKHSGRVWATGTLNKGAVFSFSIPDIKETKKILA